MEWLLAVLVLVNLIGFLALGRKVKKVALPAGVQPKALTPEPADEHKLLKTWIEANGDGVIRGWRARCSCGATNYATNATLATNNKRATFGTEANAIEAHMAHANNFNVANGNKWKDRHDALQAKFDESQEKCYCKEISPVQLIALRD